MRASVTNLGDQNLSYASPLTQLAGVLPDGSRADEAIVIDFPPCQAASAGADFARGGSYTSCFVFLAPPGARVEAVVWTAGPYDWGYYENPVVWR